jgi:predicted ribosome quality control (RQC) complex YloA/Tae2 family protein
MLERFAPAPAAEATAPAPKKRVFHLGKTELPLRLTPKIYKTLDGLEIWVGKNDQGNDVLTTRLARGKDLFFHLEGSPGSHVILRTEGRDDPPAESLLDAAELSVEFSRAKNATKASVHIAAVKDISKPRGAKPGLVHVHRGRTIQLRRDPKRLERVLGSRTEE